MINAVNLQKVATYKKFEKSKVSGKWQVSTIICYTNNYQFIVKVSIYGSRHSWEKIFTNKHNANAFVKSYIDNGFKRVA